MGEKTSQHGICCFQLDQYCRWEVTYQSIVFALPKRHLDTTGPNRCTPWWLGAHIRNIQPGVIGNSHFNFLLDFSTIFLKKASWGRKYMGRKCGCIILEWLNESEVLCQVDTTHSGGDAKAVGLVGGWGIQPQNGLTAYCQRRLCDWSPCHRLAHGCRLVILHSH